MITITTITLIITVLNSLIIGYVLLHDRLYRIDTKRIAGSLAANIIDRYAGEVHVLNEQGTKNTVGERYLEMCAAFGLPEQAVTAVTDEVWRLIRIAQGDVDEVGIYE